jgi:hypothetical protein
VTLQDADCRATLQESMCATFGAGLSSACVIDIGATKTTVACVDDGLLLNETRLAVYSFRRKKGLRLMVNECQTSGQSRR